MNSRSEHNFTPFAFQRCWHPLHRQQMQGQLRSLQQRVRRLLLRSRNTEACLHRSIIFLINMHLQKNCWCWKVALPANSLRQGQAPVSDWHQPSEPHAGQWWLPWRPVGYSTRRDRSLLQPQQRTCQRPSRTPPCSAAQPPRRSLQENERHMEFKATPAHLYTRQNKSPSERWFGSNHPQNVESSEY